jgi:hypothetical protein
MRVARQSPSGKDMSTEAEKTTVLRAITRQQLVKTYKTLCVLQYSDL